MTISGNMVRLGDRLEMRNEPQKHIGIFTNGTVWHYSNIQKKVLAEPERAFIEKFNRAYKSPKQVVEFFYGSLEL